MNRERATGTPLLLLDTGGAFLKNLEDAGNTRLTELTARAMVEGLGKIGYDALNLGRADLLLPPSLLRELAAESRFPVLSANIVDTTGNAVFSKWMVRDLGGLRVGVFGLSGTQSLGVPPRPGSDLKVLNPTTVARLTVSRLRQECDLLVVLSQLGLEADVRLASEVEGIDVILGGYTRQATPAPRIVGTTMILQSGAKGMHLGRLELRITPGRRGAWAPFGAKLDETTRGYDWRLVPLDTALPDDPALAKHLEHFREELRALNLAQLSETPVPVPPASLKPAYVGAAACGVCHPGQLRQWAASKHAKALVGLKRKRQDLNPECIRCHVTAYGEPGGYRPGQASGVDLGNVQCEACHGFGREHRGPGKIRGQVSEAICRRCHNTENSPSFRYEPYLRMLGEHAARYFTRRYGPASAPASRR